MAASCALRSELLSYVDRSAVRIAGTAGTIAADTDDSGVMTLMADIESISDRKINRITAETRHIVDVLTSRAVLLVAVVFVAALVFRAIPYRVKASKEA